MQEAEVAVGEGARRGALLKIPGAVILGILQNGLQSDRDRVSALEFCDHSLQQAQRVAQRKRA